MTRVVAGVAGGRALTVPRGSATRPTSDRVREALFGRLEALGVVDGARVLDLYAGSGALGLEALSRGAAAAVLVENGRAAAAAARANIGALGLPAHVVAQPVERHLAGAARPHDLVLLDPPYDLAEDALERVLTVLAGAGWLAEEAVVVVERSSRSPEPRWPAALRRTGERTYGETRLWFAEPRPGDG